MENSLKLFSKLNIKYIWWKRTQYEYEYILYTMVWSVWLKFFSYMFITIFFLLFVFFTTPVKRCALVWKSVDALGVSNSLTGDFSSENWFLPFCIMFFFFVRQLTFPDVINFYQKSNRTGNRCWCGKKKISFRKCIYRWEIWFPVICVKIWSSRKNIANK